MGKFIEQADYLGLLAVIPLARICCLHEQIMKIMKMDKTACYKVMDIISIIIGTKCNIAGINVVIITITQPRHVFSWWSNTLNESLKFGNGSRLNIFKHSIYIPVNPYSLAV